MLLATTTESSPSEALSGGARALKVAQATLGPAAGDVAADGADGLDAFEGAYGSQASFFFVALFLLFSVCFSLSLSSKNIPLSLRHVHNHFLAGPDRRARGLGGRSRRLRSCEKEQQQQRQQGQRRCRFVRGKKRGRQQEPEAVGLCLKR